MKNNDACKIGPYDCDKEIHVYVGRLHIMIDYDDVGHEEVEKDLKKMVSILNKHWMEAGANGCS